MTRRTNANYSWSIGCGVGEAGSVRVFVENTNNEADDSSAIPHGNGDDEAGATGPQLSPIQQGRGRFNRATEQYVAGLFKRLEVCQRQRDRRSCLNPADPVLSIDKGNRTQAGKPLEMESGERLWADGRRAFMLVALCISELSERVKQRRRVGLDSLDAYVSLSQPEQGNRKQGRQLDTRSRALDENRQPTPTSS